MKQQRIINIHKNDTDASAEACYLLCTKLESSGFQVQYDYSPEAELLIVIGGDGTLLNAVHQYDFPSMPIIGVNTGHLGFFQEIHPDDLDEFIFNYNNKRYALQELAILQALVTMKNHSVVHRGLNEIIIRGSSAYATHYNLSIGSSFIEKFSGDGILIATPAGSTAYNYSLGGSIVDPRNKVLQVTPIAPMNTTAYRAFTSSLLLPSDMKLTLAPEYIKHRDTYVLADGNEFVYQDVKKIEVTYSDTVIKLMRLENYDFWNKVKTKFI